MQNVSVIQNVLKANDEVAALNRQRLRASGVFTLDIIGAPGCGKTALLEATFKSLRELRIGVICGDLATQRDADRIAKFDCQVVQINTGKGCHLEAQHVHQALQRLELDRLDVLFIENVGNLICPVGFDLGQDAKVGVFSVTGGDDKAAKHPYIVSAASVLLLTKTDLLPHVPFDLDVFRADVRAINPAVDLLELSALTGDRMNAWIGWIGQSVHCRTR